MSGFKIALSLYFKINTDVIVKDNPDVNIAYKKALKLAGEHYENFPVVSFFLPSYLRKHVAVIYWFARTADDIADEGDISQDERKNKLEEFGENLSKSLAGSPPDEMWFCIRDTIEKFSLSPDNFYNLLDAFRQDIFISRYKTFDDLIYYCQRSANPVGRIILEFYNIRSEKAFGYSDDICTALQLTNFYQDVSVDIKKNRIYIPQAEMQNFSISEKIFENKEINDNFRNLLKFQLDRTDNLFSNGRKLLPFLPFRLKLQIKWTIMGGERILKKIRQSGYNVLKIRPSLTKSDVITLIFSSFWK